MHWVDGAKSYVEVIVLLLMFEGHIIWPNYGYRIPVDHLTPKERMYKLFYFQTQLCSTPRIVGTIQRYWEELADLHLRLWTCAPNIRHKGERVIVHNSPVIPMGMTQMHPVQSLTLTTGAMPLEEDVGVLLFGVSWSDVDVINEEGLKVINGNACIPTRPQQMIVDALRNGDRDTALAQMTYWLTPRSKYETIHYPTSKWYRKVCISMPHCSPLLLLT